MFGFLLLYALVTTAVVDESPTIIIPSPDEGASVVGRVNDMDGVPIVHVEIGFHLVTYAAPLGAVLCLEAEGESAACLAEVPSPTGVSSTHRGYLTAVGITYSLSSTARSEQQTVRLTLRDGSAAGRVLLSSPPRRFRVQPMALVLRHDAALGSQGGGGGSSVLHRFTLSSQGLHFPPNEILTLPVAALSVSLRLLLPNGATWVELARLSLGRDVLELELGRTEAVCARAAAAVPAAVDRDDAVLGGVSLRLQAVAVRFASHHASLESIAVANATLRCPGASPQLEAAAVDDRNLPVVSVRAGVGLWARTLRDGAGARPAVQLYASASLLLQLPGACGGVGGGGGDAEWEGSTKAPALEVCAAVPALASHANCVPLAQLLPPGHCDSATAQQVVTAASEFSRTKLLPLNVGVGSGAAALYVFVWLRDADAVAAAPKQFARLRSVGGGAAGSTAVVAGSATDAACQAGTASGQEGSGSGRGGDNGDVIGRVSASHEGMLADGSSDRVSPLTAAREQAVLDDYERMFEQSALWGKMTWMGVQFEQNPNDAIVLQEILYAVRPDLLIETGSHNGGSALYFASILRNFMPDFHIVSLDMTELTDHLAVRFPWVAEKVTFLKGDSTTEAMRARVGAIVAARGAKRVVVSLDSEHFAGHVLAELRNYAPFATDGSYVVVQDTRLSNPRLRHQRYCAEPALGGPCNGPAEAVRTFLAEQPVPNVYEIDRSREYLRYTNHPGGFLRVRR